MADLDLVELRRLAEGVDSRGGLAALLHHVGLKPQVVLQLLDRLEAAEARHVHCDSDPIECAVEAAQGELDEKSRQLAGMDEAYETVVAVNRRLHRERDEAVLATKKPDVLCHGYVVDPGRGAAVSGPTREQVRAALADPWHETGRVEVLTLERMTDAVMALLAAPVVAGEPESTPASEVEHSDPRCIRRHTLSGALWARACRCSCHALADAMRNAMDGFGQRYPGAPAAEEAHDA